MAAAASGVALSLEALKSSWSSLYRVRLPLQPPDDAFTGSAEGLSDALGPAIMPPPLPPLLEHRRLVLRRLQGLASRELPFSAWLAGGYGDASVQLVCTRDVVARVFKLVKERAAQLGVVVADSLKAHVTLGLSGLELQQAAAAVLQEGLAGSGWWALTPSHILGCNPLSLADGAGHTCDFLSLEYEMQEGNKMTLLAKPAVVRFRQLAATTTPGFDVAALNQKLRESTCRVLPDLRHGLVDGVEAAAPGCMEALATLWAMHGIALPPGAAATPYVLRVRFCDDPDAPTFPYPACCVLSAAGLDPLHARPDQPAVQSLLARLRDDLTSPRVPFSFGALKVVEARLWFPEGQPASGQQSAAAQAGFTFTSARQLAQAAPAEPSFKLALGSTMDLAGFSSQLTEPGDPSSGGGGCPPAKKPHARAGPRLAVFLATKAAEAEAEKAAAAAKAILQPAVKPSQAPTKPAPKRPALPGVPKSAVQAAKRKAAPAVAAPKPKAPAAPKKPKAAAAAGVAAGAAAPGGAAPAAAEASQPAAAAAAAAPAAPARARAKPADVDVAEVTARVQALHAAGSSLAGLTIPQLKAYLKSVGKAVGGKKAELEERARLHLSSERQIPSCPEVSFHWCN